MNGRLYLLQLMREGAPDECLFLSEKRSIFEDALFCILWSFSRKTMGKSRVSEDRDAVGVEPPRLQ